MSEFVIIDIDNCIAKDDWRIRYIDWSQTDLDKRYEEYHRRAGYDFAHNRHLVRETHPEAKPLFLTARPLAVREFTEKWLESKYLPRGRAYELLMRNNGDHAPSAVLKERQLHWLFEHYFVLPRQIMGAYDDRQDVVDMYCKYGIPAKRIFIHQKDAYGSSEALLAAQQAHSS